MLAELSDQYLDIECSKWDRFVVGCHDDGDGKWMSRDEDELIDRILRLGRGRTVWAHYGGRYDTLWLIEHMRRRRIPWSAVMGGGAPVAVEIGTNKKDMITVRDSYRLWPDKLAKIGEYLGVPKLELPFKCICDRRCGGYCAIEQTEEHANVLKEYLARDVDLLRTVIEWIKAFCFKHSIPLGMTVGGTAWKDAEQMLGLPRADRVLTLADSLKLRDACYGGNTQAFILRADHGEGCDIHSAYPWAVTSTPMPLTAPTWKDSAGIDETAILWATVKIPKTDLPPLPLRDTDRHRLAWVYGKITGAWTTIELRAAVARGTKIERVHAAATWADRDVKPWFRPWFDARADLRRQYGHPGGPACKKLHPTAPATPIGQWCYHSAEGAWLKWVINSFVGKTGQKPVRGKIVQGEPKCVCKRPSHKCTCCVALDPEGEYWAQTSAAVARSGHVQVNAFTTAVVRVELGEQLLAAGDSKVDRKGRAVSGRIYCDTDGVKSIGKLDRRNGDAVGEWGSEGAFETWTDPETGITYPGWECDAPKVYRLCKVGDHKNMFRVKGAPVRDERGWSEYHSTGVPQSGVHGLRGALRRGGSLFSRRDGDRRMAPPGPLVGSRRRDGNVTRACSWDEYQALADG